jgi:hypothetical protein
MAQIVKVRNKSTFLGLVESLLNGNYAVYLTVSTLTQKKDFSCDHCGAMIKTASPDDIWTVFTKEKVEGAIERRIKCGECSKENIRYWSKSPEPPIWRIGGDETEA